MASTKITEFDLDSNMDIAKESTLQEIVNAQSKAIAKSESMTLSTQGATFSGNGEGVLYVKTYAPLDSEYKVTITIDGVTLAQLLGDQYSGFVPFPFHESFTVVRGSETGSSYPAYCYAIFY